MEAQYLQGVGKNDDHIYKLKFHSGDLLSLVLKDDCLNLKHRSRRGIRSHEAIKEVGA